MDTMRIIAVAGSVSMLLAVAAPGATRKTHKLSCKEVRTAVWAGHTIDQLTAEFDTDAAHIMKCVTARKGKKPKSPASAKGTAKSPASSHQSK